MPDDSGQSLVNDSREMCASATFEAKVEHSSYPLQRRMIDLAVRKASIRQCVEWVLDLAVSGHLQKRE